MFLTLLALAAAQSAHDDLIGSYTVVDNYGRIVCRLKLFYEPSVGGEIDAPKGCAPALQVQDGLRWYADKDRGYVIRNALHKQVARIADSEAGYILYVGNTHYDLAGPDYRPPPAAAVRAVGRWKVQDNDAKVICRIQFAAGGAIGPAAACPSAVLPFGGGRWRADRDGITLTAPGTTQTAKTYRIDWEDEDELASKDLKFAFVRDRGK